MKVSPQYVVDHYDAIAAAVEGGEVVEVSLPEKPALRLVRAGVSQSQSQASARVLGAGKALLRVPSDEEWTEMDKDWRKSFQEKFDAEHA